MKPVRCCIVCGRVTRELEAHYIEKHAPVPEKTTLGLWVKEKASN